MKYDHASTQSMQNLTMEGIMKAEKLTQEKIKLTINGKTSFHTRDELREYFDSLYTENNEALDDSGFERIIVKLNQYDGDIYGQLQDDEQKKTLHELLEKGVIPVVY